MTTHKYSSMEFMSDDFIPVRIFPVYNITSIGTGIIVREGSDTLKHLKVGKVIEVRFTLSDPDRGFERHKVEISSITRDDHGRLKGHYSIGLSILKS